MQIKSLISGFVLSIAMTLGSTSIATAQEGGFAAKFWASYEKNFTAECMAGSDPMIKEAMPEICGCALEKIETNHSISEVKAESVPESTYEEYGEQCTYEAFDKPGPYTPGVRSALVDNCVAEGGMGDDGPAYCSCFVDKMEAEFTFTDLMKNQVSDDDYERLGADCMLEIIGG